MAPKRGKNCFGWVQLSRCHEISYGKGGSIHGLDGILYRKRLLSGRAVPEEKEKEKSSLNSGEGEERRYWRKEKKSRKKGKR